MGRFWKAERAATGRWYVYELGPDDSVLSVHGPYLKREALTLAVVISTAYYRGRLDGARMGV